MYIIIHRGSAQIGGCVTEFATANTKVFIDLGANLPGNDIPLPEIDGLTVGNGTNSALFISHTHGDHIGALDKAMPDVKVYMGKTAQEIELVKTRKLDKASEYIGTELVTKTYLSRIENAQIFQMGKIVKVGDIEVTPLWVDHSAFDAYMFVIESNGVRVLHTGDFRTHGPRGAKLPDVLAKYARNIDYIVCEGTMLSRSSEPISEWKVGETAQDLIRGKKYIFALCSSTNIDRIAEFYQANHADNKERRFVVDKYQREVLDVITKLHGGCTGFYKFDYAVWRNPWYPAHNDELEQRGFFTLIRGNGSRFETEMLERYFDPSNSLLIYSMWDGYLKPGVTANENYIALYEKYQPHEILHTSGHASQRALTELYRLLKPKRGLIPIHTEFPDSFADIIPDGNIIRVNDGEVKQL